METTRDHHAAWRRSSGLAVRMITPEAVIGPRIDLAVDDLVEPAGGRLILRSCVNTDRQATDNDRPAEVILPIVLAFVLMLM
jgi:hypothetical protein